MANIRLSLEKHLNCFSLSLHDRSLLLHEKLKHICSIITCFVVHHVGLFDNPAFDFGVEMIYGSAILLASKLTSKLVDSDIVFIKIVLLILTFSTLDYAPNTNTTPTNLENPIMVLRIQNIYIELAWQYLINKYSHSRAVNSFANLMRCIFFWM